MPVGSAIGTGFNSDGSLASNKIVTVANPAPGADWTFTSTQSGLLLAMTAALATSATVGTRGLVLFIRDPANKILSVNGNSTTQAASLTFTYTAFPGALGGNISGILSIPIPAGLVLAPGSKIISSTAGIQVGDQWSNIVLTFAGP